LVSACGGSDPASTPPPSAPSAIAPSITAQPLAVTATEGDAATFSVTATGTAPLAYQWKRGGVDIAGANAATYSLAAATLADNGASFAVTVSNSAGSASSNAAALTVNARVVAPVITLQPTSSTVSEGATVTLTVTASGTSLAYQWKRNGADIAGAAAASYTFTATAADNGATFAVVVSNSAGSVTSTAALLTVNRGNTYLVGLAGGTIRVGNDDVIVDVPAGALTADTTFTLRPADSFGELDPDFRLIPGTVWDISATGGGLVAGQQLRVRIRVAAGSIPAPARVLSRVRPMAAGDPSDDLVSVVRCPDDRVLAYWDDDPSQTGYGKATYTCTSGNGIDGRLGVGVRRPVAPGAIDYDRALTASAIDAMVVDRDGQVTVTYITGVSQDDQRLARYSASGTRISDMAVPGLTGSRLTILAIGSSGQIAAVHNRRVPDTGDGSSQRRLVVYRTAPAGLIGSVTGLTQSYQEVLSFPIHPLNRIRGLALTQDGALLVVGRTEDLTSDVLGGAPWGGLRGCFIARINRNGALAWAKPLTPNGTWQANLMCDALRTAPGTLAAEATGAAYVAGEDVTNQDGTAACTFATGAGCPAVYKYDANGNPVWRRVLSILYADTGVGGSSTRVAIDPQGNVLASAVTGGGGGHSVARLSASTGDLMGGALLSGAPTNDSNARSAARLSFDGAGNVYAGVAHLMFRFSPDLASGVALDFSVGTGVLATQQLAIGADVAGNAYGSIESGEFTSNANLHLRKLRYP
jgi:hypothetical protein